MGYKIGDTFTFNSTGVAQQFIVPSQIKRVKLECWGSQGQTNGGKGGYTQGEINLNPNDVLNIYVGNQTGYNGGGTGTNGGGKGGGGTDIRLNDTSLAKRIIVAGGGGGGISGYIAGYGGGLIAGDGNNVLIVDKQYGSGATQTSGNALGIGGNAYNNGSSSSGGGGGYYGGCGGCYHYIPGTGGGGSSYYGTLENASTTANINIGDGKVIITVLQLNNKFVIQDGNNIKIINNTDIITKDTLPYTSDKFNNYGMSDLSLINSDIINKLDNQKYKIALYKK